MRRNNSILATPLTTSKIILLQDKLNLLSNETLTYFEIFNEEQNSGSKLVIQENTKAEKRRTLFKDQGTTITYPRERSQSI